MLAQRGREFSGAKKKEALEVWFHEEIDNMKASDVGTSKTGHRQRFAARMGSEKNKVPNGCKEEGRTAGYAVGKLVGIVDGRVLGRENAAS
tara:strand:+ start:11039 stop:11311 length:273 start_codon:yes stop_codon:yes gene_type:complete